MFEAAYPRLRRVAVRVLIGERPGHTLQPTALVHEAFMRMRRDSQGFSRCGELVMRMARTMRNVLIDHARRKHSLKRGGGEKRIPLDETVAVYESRAMDLLALHEALEELVRVDDRMATIVELRFVAGLSEIETAEVLGVSAVTVRREWRLARNWLAGRLCGDERRGRRTVA